MMKHEFENIAEYEVSNEDYYNVIEPMYMATTLSKQEFVDTLNKKRFALKTKKQMLNEMKKLAEHLKESCTHYIDTESKDELCRMMEEYIERFHFGVCNFYFDHTERWGCSYPSKAVIFTKKNFNTVETIELV